MHRRSHVHLRRGTIVLMLAAALLADEACGQVLTRPFEVTAVVPYWNTGNGFRAIAEQKERLTAVSPWMLGVNAQGAISTHKDADLKVDQASFISQVRRTTKARILPTISNYHDKEWQTAAVRKILHDAQRTEQHVHEIVRSAQEGHWDGVTIDYEELGEGDREAFTVFLRTLSAELHERGYLLAVDVFAKASDAGYGDRNKAQDFAAIGSLADEVRLMAYDYHWSTSSPGSVAPKPWVEAVLAYAVTVVPKEKLVLGLPLYGYNWSNGKGQPVSWREVSESAKSMGIAVYRDSETGSPWLEYTETGSTHIVWFEDAGSLGDKISLARRVGVKGVFLWMYGPEDPALWRALGKVHDL